MPDISAAALGSLGFLRFHPQTFRYATSAIQSLLMAGKYLLSTLGCKVNQYESQQLREVLESAGLRPAGVHEVPDIVVVNTCAVTVSAARKSRQVIRRAQGGGGAPVVVVGCGASSEAERLSQIDGVAAVFGHDVDVSLELRRFVTQRLGGSPIRSSDQTKAPGGIAFEHPQAQGYDGWMKPGMAQNGPDGSEPRTTQIPLQIITPKTREVKKLHPLTERIEAFAGHQRAFLKIQDGCDAHCSYCIIPRLRPRLRSKPIETAVREAGDLVLAGHKEIILTGIFLGAYGRETAIRRRWSNNRSPLSQLVEALAGIEGLARLRLSSLEPGDVDQALLDVLAAHPVCVPHLHLPLQSGSEDVLRRMNRQYSRTDFASMIDSVKAALDRPAISTDIIVGFPSETEEEFASTLEMAKFAQFCKIHAFPYSPRPGTPASRRSGDFVDPALVRERMARLGEVERESSLAFRQQFLGCTERVIVEASPDIDAADEGRDNTHRGRADRYFEIHFQSETVRAGDIVDVRVDRLTATRTHGTEIPQIGSSYPLAVLDVAEMA